MAAATSKKKKTSQKAIPAGKELTFEKVLAMMKEKERQIKESTERFDRKMKEKERQIKESAERFDMKMKETERQIKESAERLNRKMKDGADRPDQQMKGNAERFDWEMKGNAEWTDREMRETDRWTGRPDRLLGDSNRYMDLPNLMHKFRELGFVFERTYKDATINDKKNNISIVIDITLESSDKIMIVETRTKPTTEGITKHIERMREVRRYGDLHGEKRKYLGAIAGKDFSDNVKTFAMKNGFYIIEPSEETFIITAPEGIYSPREW